MTLHEGSNGYSAFKPVEQPTETCITPARTGEGNLRLAHPPRVKRLTFSGIPHLPFQEFTVSSLEALLNILKKARIKDSEIEVSTSEESQHTTCSKPIIHVLVMTAKGEGAGEHKDLAALYQYCPGCGSAVRVL